MLIRDKTVLIVVSVTIQCVLSFLLTLVRLFPDPEHYLPQILFSCLKYSSVFTIFVKRKKSHFSVEFEFFILIFLNLQKLLLIFQKNSREGGYILNPKRLRNFFLAGFGVTVSIQIIQKISISKNNKNHILYLKT